MGKGNKLKFLTKLFVEIMKILTKQTLLDDCKRAKSCEKLSLLIKFNIQWKISKM